MRAVLNLQIERCIIGRAEQLVQRSRVDRIAEQSEILPLGKAAGKIVRIRDLFNVGNLKSGKGAVCYEVSMDRLVGLVIAVTSEAEVCVLNGRLGYILPVQRLVLVAKY